MLAADVGTWLDSASCVGVCIYLFFRVPNHPIRAYENRRVSWRIFQKEHLWNTISASWAQGTNVQYRLPKRSSCGLGLCMVVHHRQRGYACVSWIFNAGASRRLRLIMLSLSTSFCNVSFLKYGQLFGKESWWNLCRNNTDRRRNCDNCHVRSQS